MRTAPIALLLLLVLGCPREDEPGTDTSGTAGDTGIDSGADTDTGTDTSADTDTAGTTETGGDTFDTSDTEPDCGEDGFCELVVTDIELGYASPSSPRVLTATSTGPGTVEVVDSHFTDGCCPSIAITATASLRDYAIEPTYTLTEDDCDCYTGLAVSYTLTGIPSGTWELRQGDARVTVELP